MFRIGTSKGAPFFFTTVFVVSSSLFFFFFFFRSALRSNFCRLLSSFLAARATTLASGVWDALCCSLTSLRNRLFFFATVSALSPLLYASQYESSVKSVSSIMVSSGTVCSRRCFSLLATFSFFLCTVRAISSANRAMSSGSAPPISSSRSTADVESSSSSITTTVERSLVRRTDFLLSVHTSGPVPDMNMLPSRSRRNRENFAAASTVVVVTPRLIGGRPSPSLPPPCLRSSSRAATARPLASSSIPCSPKSHSVRSSGRTKTERLSTYCLEPTASSSPRRPASMPSLRPKRYRWLRMANV
eukprot:PhM_4_TR9830/c0_g1_i1/m.13450